MVELYKFIAFIPLLNQIFDDKNKNCSVKGANYKQVYMREKFEFVISFYSTILFLIITNRVNMQYPVYFNHETYI